LQVVASIDASIQDRLLAGTSEQQQQQQQQQMPREGSDLHERHTSSSKEQVPCGTEAGATAQPQPPSSRMHGFRPLNFTHVTSPKLSPRMFVPATQQQQAHTRAAEVAEDQFGTTFGSPVEGEEAAATPAPWEVLAGSSAMDSSYSRASCQQQQGALGAPEQATPAEGVAHALHNVDAEAACVSPTTQPLEIAMREGEGEAQEGEKGKGAEPAGQVLIVADRDAGAQAPAVKECTAEWVGQDTDVNVEEVEVEVPVHSEGVTRTQAGTASSHDVKEAGDVPREGEVQARAAAAAAKEGHGVVAAAPAAAAAAVAPRVQEPARTAPQPKAKKASRGGGGFCACFAPKVQE